MNHPSQIFVSPVKKLVETLGQEGDGDNKKDEPFWCLTQGARISRSPCFLPEKNGVSKLVYLCSK
jgi:hypothetical protein